MCCTPECSNRCTQTISLHNFPKAVTLQKQWQWKLKIGKKLPKNAQVCSVHLKPEDFVNISHRKRKLHPNVVPSVNLPKTSIERKLQLSSPRKEKITKRAERAKKGEVRKNNSSQNLCTDVDNFSTTLLLPCSLNFESLEADEEENRYSEVDGNDAASSYSQPVLCNSSIHDSDQMEAALILIGMNEARDFKTCKTTDKAIQVGLDFPIRYQFTILDLLKTDKHINAFCGISTFGIFENVVQLCEYVHNRLPNKPNIRSDLREIIALCLMKLKLDISFTLLGACFGISTTTAISYFHFTIDILYETFKNVITWPTKQEIENSMPECFKQYPNTRIILDCSETKIDMPNCLACRIRTYSHYKGGHTIKYMVGMAPSGLITFCSNVYGGKASDKQIFSESQVLLNKLEVNDGLNGVMVDKGFLIDEICEQYNCTVIRPPFLRNKSQFSEAEAELNTTVAAARVHIERIYQRIKVFRIFRNCLPLYLLHKSDKILHVICALVNLKPPIT